MCRGEEEIEHWIWKSGDWAWDSWLCHWPAVYLREGLWHGLGSFIYKTSKSKLFPENPSCPNILFYMDFHRPQMLIWDFVWESAASGHYSRTIVRNSKTSSGGIWVPGDPRKVSCMERPPDITLERLVSTSHGSRREWQRPFALFSASTWDLGDLHSQGRRMHSQHGNSLCKAPPGLKNLT